MKNKKLFSILCLTLTASMVLYGCSGTSSSSSSTDHTSQEAEAQANTVTAQITSIDGSTVTATVGALTAAQAPGGDNGNAPSGEAPVKPDDENASGGAPDSSVPSGEAPAKPDGDNANGDSSDGNAPSGEAPAKPNGDNANGGAPDGNGGPAVYSTADITVKNATLTANNSEGLVIEGKNSIALENCDVTGNMTTSNGGSDEDNLHAVMIYQSMSGDAAMGEASFSSDGGSITSLSGDLFYVTNTSCTISLKDTKLVTANDQLLTIAGNNSSRGWGTSGSNGGDVVLTASSQEMDGNITVDDISTLDMTLSDGSAFTGSINSTGDAGDVSVTLDSSSTWTLTGDSYITSFDGDLSQINANGYQLYVNGSAVL